MDLGGVARTAQITPLEFHSHMNPADQLAASFALINLATLAAHGEELLKSADLRQQLREALVNGANGITEGFGNVGRSMAGRASRELNDATAPIFDGVSRAKNLLNTGVDTARGAITDGISAGRSALVNGVERMAEAPGNWLDQLARKINPSAPGPLNFEPGGQRSPGPRPDMPSVMNTEGSAWDGLDLPGGDSFGGSAMGMDPTGGIGGGGSFSFPKGQEEAARLRSLGQEHITDSGANGFMGGASDMSALTQDMAANSGNAPSGFSGNPEALQPGGPLPPGVWERVKAFMAANPGMAGAGLGGLAGLAGGAALGGLGGSDEEDEQDPGAARRRMILAALGMGIPASLAGAWAGNQIGAGNDPRGMLADSLGGALNSLKDGAKGLYGNIMSQFNGGNAPAQ